MRAYAKCHATGPIAMAAFNGLRVLRCSRFRAYPTWCSCNSADLLLLPAQMQQRAVATFGSAYRTLSADAALGLLCLQGAGLKRLHALLTSCAEQGMLPAQRALSAAQMAEGHAREVLVFHA